MAHELSRTSQHEMMKEVSSLRGRLARLRASEQRAEHTVEGKAIRAAVAYGYGKIEAKAIVDGRALWTLGQVEPSLAYAALSYFGEEFLHVKGDMGRYLDAASDALIAVWAFKQGVGLQSQQVQAAVQGALRAIAAATGQQQPGQGG